MDFPLDRDGSLEAAVDDDVLVTLKVSDEPGPGTEQRRAGGSGAHGRLERTLRIGFSEDRQRPPPEKRGSV